MDGINRPSSCCAIIQCSSLVVMWSVVLLIILSGSWVHGAPVQAEETLETFQMANLCNLYYTKKQTSNKNECHSCFTEVFNNYEEDDRNGSEDYAAEIRDCVSLLPTTFHVCSQQNDDENMKLCLKERARTFFKHKFQKFWKRWKDLFNERERGRVHQIFSFKSILKQIGNQSREHLEEFLRAFEPCLHQAAYKEDGRGLTYFDSLDAAALEGTEDDNDDDEDKLSRIERSEERENSNVTTTDAETTIAAERQNDKVSTDSSDKEKVKEDLEKKKTKLNGYIGDAYQVFVCKIVKIKENQLLTNIMKETLKHFDGVVPAELLRVLYTE